MIENCGNCHICLAGQFDEVTGLPVRSTRMIVCPTCGNKRCPKATEHTMACTGSNEPGQVGSIYCAPYHSQHLMTDFTEAQYKAAIPGCCSKRTLQEHMAMMLCWGLASALRAGKAMDCNGCELRLPDSQGDKP